jgi:hypothetical protein
MFVATKKEGQLKFFPPLLLLLLDPEWTKVRIPDKQHPGSSTLSNVSKQYISSLILFLVIFAHSDPGLTKVNANLDPDHNTG